MLSLYQKRRVTQAFRHAWVCLMHALENTNSWCLYDVNECRLFMRGKVSFLKKKRSLLTPRKYRSSQTTNYDS